MDTPRKAKVRRVVTMLAAQAGLRVEKLEDDATFVPGRSIWTTDLQRKFAGVPGMITLRRGMYLYWLALAQSIPGDVVELGSWQGRSTIALAQACADADNGMVHAVDTFRGNPGNTSMYVVGADDLSDLESNFRRNIARAGLTDRVTAHAMTSAEAAPAVAAAAPAVRFIYIDAEHTYDAVRQDLANYAELLAPGGLLTFDDYSKTFDGVVRAVHEHLDAHPDRYTLPVQDNNFLVLRRRL
jgi:predicted O-methyltransferase YrrM